MLHVYCVLFCWPFFLHTLPTRFHHKPSFWASWVWTSLQHPETVNSVSSYNSEPFSFAFFFKIKLFFIQRAQKKKLVKDKAQCTHCWSGSETSDLSSFRRFFLSSSQQDANRSIKALLALNGCQSRGQLSKDLAHAVRLKVKPFHKSLEKFFWLIFLTWRTKATNLKRHFTFTHLTNWGLSVQKIATKRQCNFKLHLIHADVCLQPAGLFLDACGQEGWYPRRLNWRFRWKQNKLKNKSVFIWEYF